MELPDAAASSCNAADDADDAEEKKNSDDGGDSADYGVPAAAGELISKRQQKRLAKKLIQKDKRKDKKEAVKAAKRAKREAGQVLWDSLTEEEREEQRRKSAVIRAERAAAEKVEAEAAARADDDSREVPTCVVDLDFEKLMNDREIASLASQLSYCYCANRRASFPMKLSYTSFGGSTSPKTEANLTCGYRNWHGVRYEARHVLEAYPRERLIYLSSEGEEVLTTPLEKDAVYIVGGLVDHNREKGLTHRLAMEAGGRTARLPIDEHCDMSTRKVLAVNHVVEILVQLASGVGWQQSLLTVIPERKGAKEKEEGGEGGQLAPPGGSGSGDAAAEEDEVGIPVGGGAMAAGL